MWVGLNERQAKTQLEIGIPSMRGDYRAVTDDQALSERSKAFIRPQIIIDHV